MRRFCHLAGQGRGDSTGIAGSPQHFYLPTAVQRTVGGHQNIRIFFIVYCFVYNKQVAPKFCSFPVKGFPLISKWTRSVDSQHKKMIMCSVDNTLSELQPSLLNIFLMHLWLCPDVSWEKPCTMALCWVPSQAVIVFHKSPRVESLSLCTSSVREKGKISRS